MLKLHEPAIVRSAADLRILANEINHAHQAGEQSTRRGLEQFKEAGVRLLKVKEQVGYGNFKSWLDKNITFSQRTANRYMRLAKDWPKFATVSNLTEALATFAQDADEPGDTPDPAEPPTDPADTTPSDQPPVADDPWEQPSAEDGSQEPNSEAANDLAASATAPGAAGEGVTEIPKRLQPFFADVARFGKAARLAVVLANLFQEIEQTPAYRLAVDGKKHRENSTYIRSAGRAIEAMTPRRPCPECGGKYEPSQDNEPCKTCGDRGYLTAEEVAQ